MTVFSGRVYDSQFITKIVEHLTGIPVGGAEPYWRQVNSGLFTSEGVILESKGTSGSDSIFVQIKKGASNYISIRTLYKYLPNIISGIDGTFESATAYQAVYWHNQTYSPSVPFNYWLSFDRDRIMLFLSPDKTISNIDWGDLLWVGMPERISEEEDSTAVTTAVSRFSLATSGYGAVGDMGLYSKGMTLKNGVKANNVPANMVVPEALRSVGWGFRILLPNIYVENGEGVRSIMHGIHPLYQPIDNSDFRHMDEIMVGSKRYKIFQTHVAPIERDSSCFPSNWMAVEQLL